MLLSQLKDQSSEPDSEEEEDDDGVTTTDSELVDAYYEAMGHLGECVDFLESAALTMPRKRQLRLDIEAQATKVREFLEEEGFVEERE